MSCLQHGVFVRGRKDRQRVALRDTCQSWHRSTPSRQKMESLSLSLIKSSIYISRRMVQRLTRIVSKSVTNHETLVMDIPFKTSGISGSSYIFCHVDQQLTRISHMGRRDAFTKEHVWIKKGARACKSYSMGRSSNLKQSTQSTLGRRNWIWKPVSS